MSDDLIMPDLVIEAYGTVTPPPEPDEGDPEQEDQP